MKISNEKLNQMARLYAEQFDVGTREHAEEDYVSGFRAAEKMSEARIAELESAVREMAGALAQFDEYCPVFEPTGCCTGRDCGCYGKPINPEYYLNGLARTTLEKHRALIEALKGEYAKKNNTQASRAFN
jgi:hypothetical protein